jgi:hypothetical protein
VLLSNVRGMIGEARSVLDSSTVRGSRSAEATASSLSDHEATIPRFDHHEGAVDAQSDRRHEPLAERLRQEPRRPLPRRRAPPRLSAVSAASAPIVA